MCELWGISCFYLVNWQCSSKILRSSFDTKTDTNIQILKIQAYQSLSVCHVFVLSPETYNSCIFFVEFRWYHQILTKETQRSSMTMKYQVSFECLKSEACFVTAQLSAMMDHLIHWSLAPKQYGWHLAYIILKFIFLNEIDHALIWILLTFFIYFQRSNWW